MLCSTYPARDQSLLYNLIAKHTNCIIFLVHKLYQTQTLGTHTAPSSVHTCLKSNLKSKFMLYQRYKLKEDMLAVPSFQHTHPFTAVCTEGSEIESSFFTLCNCAYENWHIWSFGTAKQNRNFGLIWLFCWEFMHFLVYFYMPKWHGSVPKLTYIRYASQQSAEITQEASHKPAHKGLLPRPHIRTR